MGERVATHPYPHSDSDVWGGAWELAFTQDDPNADGIHGAGNAGTFGMTRKQAGCPGGRREFCFVLEL